MCIHSKEQAKVLANRQKGLDARGNVPAHTKAESNWAVATLADLDSDQEAMGLLRASLTTLHNQTEDDLLGKKFHKGFVKVFGKMRDREPDAKQLVDLMLADEYDFKSATDAQNSDQKREDKKLYEQTRKNMPEFQNRGRREGYRRKGSVSNPDAGITDRLYRDPQTKNFFDTAAFHAKGTLEGDVQTATYKRFKEAGAPFIGGASGTMQGIAMAMELEKKKNARKGEVEAADANDKREKLIGIYMATLVAGGHHSASECLLSAKGYGYFQGVPDPLADYKGAMEALGVRFQALGLKGGLKATQEVGPSTPWIEARAQTVQSLTALRGTIGAAYRGRGNKFLAELLAAYDKVQKTVIDLFFGGELETTLDDMAKQRDEAARKKYVDMARKIVTELQAKTKDPLLKMMDENPFAPIAIRATVSTALTQLSQGVVG